MVNVNLFDNETGSFWKAPGTNPADIQTEVFMLPCAASYEKEGSLSNSGRLVQWRYKAVNPPGQAMPDAEIMNELYNAVKALYVKEGGAYPDPIKKLTWNYGFKGLSGTIKHIDISAVAKEMNGTFLREVTGRQGQADRADLQGRGSVPSFAFLQADGSTAAATGFTAAATSARPTT